MDKIVSFPGGRFAPLNMIDGDWFAHHPDREHYLRRATPVEARQAACHHGHSLAYSVVVRTIEPSIFVRRFVVGALRDSGEDHARETFRTALVAGEEPRLVRDLPQFGGAA